MDVLNSTVDDLYGDIDEMYISKTSALPETETETSTSLNQPSSNHAPTDKEFSDIDPDDAGNGDSEDECIYDDFILYDETIGEEIQQRTDSHNELKKQCELLMSKLTRLETENKSLHLKYNKTEQENLEAKRNIARLLLTTKGEINRKDKEIANLRMMLSASPHGRRNTAMGSSSFSSIDSDFDPLCVSSPGNSKLKRSNYIRFQSSQENSLSSLSYTENTDAAGSRSSRQGRSRKEINRDADGLAKSNKMNDKPSRSAKDSDDVRRDNSKLKTSKSGAERKENIKSHDIKDSKIKEKSDILPRSDRSNKLEDERKDGNSVSEKYQKADTKNLTFRNSVKKSSNYSSDRVDMSLELRESSDRRSRVQSGDKWKNVDATSENDKQNETDNSDKVKRTKLNEKSKVEDVKCADSGEKCDDANTKHCHKKTSETGEKLTGNITSEKKIEGSEDINRKKVISYHDSVKSTSKTISCHETAGKQVKPSRKERERHKSGDTGKMAELERNKSGERRITERERNKRTDERRKVIDQDRAKSVDKKQTEHETRINERVRQKSCEDGNRRRETVVAECVGNSDSLSKPKVLDLREKLRQKRLKSESINNGNPDQNICMPKRGQTKSIQSQNVKKSINEEVCDTNSSYEIDFLEYSNNEICEIWDAGKNEETKEQEPKHDKNPKKEEIVSKERDETSVIKSKSNKDARKAEINNKPKKCANLNEDLEFLNKLKSSIQKESLPSSSNSEKTNCSSSKSDIPLETLSKNIKKRIEKSNVTSQCVEELHLVDSGHQNSRSVEGMTEASSENIVNFSEIKSESITAEKNNLKTHHHEKNKSGKVDVASRKKRSIDFETHVGKEKITKLKSTKEYQSSKSDNADSTSDSQAVCNKYENDEHITREREKISPKLLDAHSSREQSDSSVSVSKTSSVHDKIAVSNEADPEKCTSDADEYPLDKDDSGSCAGVSSETVSSCTSSKMSKSVMEFFQTIDEKAEGKKNESVISDTSKSNSPHVDKLFSCNVKNCSIKMRHLHPKQSNKKSVHLKSDMDQVICGVENSENHKVVAHEISSSGLDNFNDNIYPSETLVESGMDTKSRVAGSHHRNSKISSLDSSSEMCNNDTVQFDDKHPLKNVSQSSTKSSMKGNTPLSVPSVQTGNIEEKDLTSGTNKTNESIHETEVQLKCSSELNKTDLLVKIRDLKTSSISVNDICERGPDVETEDLDVEGTAENESEGSFGSNIVSEKTESWRSSDDSDDSCSTYSGDSSSDTGDGDSDSSIDNTDYASSLSHTSDDSDDYTSDLEDNSREKPVIKSTSDASNHNSITMMDKSVPRSKSTSPLIKNSNPEMTSRKLTSLDAVSEHENTSSPVATGSESISGTVSENEVGVTSNSLENKLISCSGNEINVCDLESVNSSAVGDKENAVVSKEKKSVNVVSEHVALNEKPLNNGSSRSNMLLQLLNCVEKEFIDKKTFSVGQECPPEDNSQDDGDEGFDDTNPSAEKDVTESVNIVKKCVEDKTCDALNVAIVENDHNSKHAEEVVKDISPKIQLKNGTCNLKTNVNTFNHGVNSEDTSEKLFEHSLSDSSYCSSGSESDTDSGSSYSSHSSDCSTCSSSYSSDSSSSSDNDSEDEDNFTDNLKAVKQTEKNKSVKQTHKNLNTNYKIQEAKTNSKKLLEVGTNEMFEEPSLEVNTNKVLEEPSQALCDSGNKINKMLTVLVERCESLETNDHDLPANLSDENNTKSTKTQSMAKKAVPTQCKSSKKLHSQTYKAPATPSSVNNNTNKVSDETCVTRCRSGGKITTVSADRNCATKNKLGERFCSHTIVSPQTLNPYLIVDEIPEFLTLTGSNNRSSNCELPRGSKKTISPKNMASPAAVFISPKKVNSDTSQTACDYSLGVIGSVDSEKDSVRKSKSVSSFSSSSDQSKLSVKSSSHCIDKPKHNENVEHKQMRATRSRNNSHQSSQLDITEKVTKKSRVPHVETERRKPLNTSHKKTNIKKKDLGHENSSCSSGEDEVLDGHSQALFEAKELSETGQKLRRSPRKKFSFTNHAGLSATMNDKKIVTNDKRSGKKMYIDSAGALFGKALTENSLVKKKKNDHKLSDDKNLCRSEKKSEKRPASGKKSVSSGNVKSKQCKNIGKYSDKISDEPSIDSNIGKQSVISVSDIHVVSEKKFGGSGTINTSEPGIDNKTTSSRGPVKLDYKSPEDVGKKSVCWKKGKSNVTENRPNRPSCSLSSPIKKFTIPKLKRKACISPQEEQKILEKRRKPLQTVSPLKSTPSICLKRTSDGKWLKTQSNTNTVRVSEINYCSSSDESSEDSSIVKALFGNSTDEKVVETHDTERQSEESSKRKVKDSGSKVEKNKERLSKNTKSDHLGKEKNSKSLPSKPLLFLDEHTMDKTDYEDVLCLDNCDDDFNDDISDDSLEDGEISPASEPENKFKYSESVSKNKSGEAKNVNGSNDVYNDSKDVCNNSKDVRSKNGTTKSNIKKLRVDDKVSQKYRQRNDERKSPRYKNRGRPHSRSPRDSVFRSQSSYDRSRKYSKDSYLSPRDRRNRPHKRRRSRSNSRHRDSDSFRSKRRNTSLHS